MAIKDFFTRDERFGQNILPFELVGIIYAVITTVMMFINHYENYESMMALRVFYIEATLAAWVFYFMRPNRFLLLLRVIVQMASLSWWYPDTYEVNRIFPNLDHLFAACEQAVFSCQPSLLFSQYVPWGWFSELMCLGYVSYFPLMTLLLLYYFFRRYDELPMAAFIMLASFFAFYLIFIFLPVTGPQFYYLAVGTDNIAQGIFPNVGDWFLTHTERMAAPGWSDGFFYHLLDLTHDAGERPTAAFPSRSTSSCASPRCTSMPIMPSMPSPDSSRAYYSIISPCAPINGRHCTTISLFNSKKRRFSSFFSYLRGKFQF